MCGGNEVVDCSTKLVLARVVGLGNLFKTAQDVGGTGRVGIRGVLEGLERGMPLYVSAKIVEEALGKVGVEGHGQETLMSHFARDMDERAVAPFTESMSRVDNI
ncbi:hypothetical protein FZEAL_9881 [Fusarium zealandicum]|uniref:Uncharacterized protein n=1 Tax=Fusarium zealandicum TaxID=1053134 RepID=A0A8H4U840_9HYPO|nr:hypothetical protein FZEAL_9881 [Fusarium zealandicum]